MPTLHLHTHVRNGRDGTIVNKIKDEKDDKYSHIRRPKLLQKQIRSRRISRCERYCRYIFISARTSTPIYEYMCTAVDV